MRRVMAILEQGSGSQDLVVFRKPIKTNAILILFVSTSLFPSKSRWKINIFAPRMLPLAGWLVQPATNTILV